MALDFKFHDPSCELNPCPWQDVVKQIYKSTRQNPAYEHFQNAKSNVQRITECQGRLDESDCDNKEEVTNKGEYYIGDDSDGDGKLPHPAPLLLPPLTLPPPSLVSLPPSPPPPLPPSLPISLQVLEEFLKNLSSKAGTKKDEKTAADLRQTGNKYFQKKLFKEALECYNKSIMTAKSGSEVKDEKAESQLSFAYANRSAVLYHLAQYKSCRADIERALNCGYPERLQSKLYQRKGQCYLQEEEIQCALEAFQKALELCKLSDSEEPTKASSSTKELDKLMSRCQNTRKQVQGAEKPKKGGTETTDKFESSTIVANAIDCVVLSYNEEYGRHLFTSEELQVGDVVVQEDPYVAVLLPTHYDSHCYQCIKPTTLTPIPCPQCCDVRYCSDACQEVSWKSCHWLECSLWSILKHVDTFGLISLRIVLKAGHHIICNYEKLRHDENPAWIQGCDSSDVYQGDYESVYHLMTHSDKQSDEDVFYFTMTAILLSKLVTKYLQHNHNVSAEADDDINQQCKTEGDGQHNALNEKAYAGSENIKKTDDRLSNLETLKLLEESDFFDKPLTAEEMQVGDLLLHHMLQLRCNVHAITAMQTVQEKNPERLSELHEVHVETTNQVRVASAVYPTASLMNHSCDPNVIASYRGNQLTIRATRKINKGQEILHCYGPHVKHMSKDERQRSLREQYFFDCHCTACEIDSELGNHYGNKRDAFMCNKCGSAVVPDRSAETHGHCVNPNCKRQKNLVQAYKLADQSRKLFLQAVELLELDQVQDSLAILHECYEVQQTILYRHHQQLAETQDCLARCYVTLGENEIAIKYLKLSIETVEITYGKDSIELANELTKLAQILFNSHEEEEALTITNRALDIFTIHYGPNHPSCVELLEMQAVLKWSTQQSN
ncbi:protein-lysine N-methyltransferase SMYD4-like [Glandiceps talaboti]